MNTTILGFLWRPIVKLFTMVQTKLHLDIFKQQGLVPPPTRRPPKIASST